MLTDILHNLVASTVVLILCLTTLWAISIKMRDASIIDIFWGAFGHRDVARSLAKGRRPW